MNREVKIDNLWIPEELYAAVEKHRNDMIEAHKDSDNISILLNATFSMYFGDYLMKNYNKLLK